MLVNEVLESSSLELEQWSNAILDCKARVVVRSPREGLLVCPEVLLEAGIGLRCKEDPSPFRVIPG